MSEDLIINNNLSKEDRYKELLPQLQALVEGEVDVIANLSNLTAALKQAFNWWWVGFYLVKNNQLVLGPFQGPIACARINMGKGVCGTAWEKKETVIVDDVDQFPGHIACSAASRSEIVLPIIKNNEVIMILDVDSEHLAHFNETDSVYLQKIVELIEKML